MHDFKLMQRVLKEQCQINADNAKNKVGVKPPKEIPSNSLQNPSDPDSTYSGHKGQGYQVQVMETFTTTEDKKEKEETLNLITHVAVEKACEQDVHALLPAIRDAKEKGLDPKTVLGDTLYGSDENSETAKDMGVELIAPAQGAACKGIGLKAFTFDDKGYVKKCPMGKAPQSARYKNKTGRFNIRFDKDGCRDCPLYEDCPTRKNKKFNMLTYDKRALRMALRRVHEESEAFINSYRMRAGVEATMSEYKTLTGVKRLRVRGFANIRFSSVLKAVGVNLIMRAAMAQKARRRGNEGQNGLYLRTVSTFSFFKEQFYQNFLDGNKNHHKFYAADEFFVNIAA